MSWPVIIKDGPDLNQTLAGIKFNKFGALTNQPIFVCDDWVLGYQWAKQHQYKQALFVNSGTVIVDWEAWHQLIDNYPHSGLIAHLIWRPGQFLFLDEQCWFMDIDKFNESDFCISSVSYPEPIRSDKNLHDDYTPLWVRPGKTMVSHSATNFGQGLVSAQLNSGQPIVNFNNTARDLKSFLYNKDSMLDKFTEYKCLAENQLWVFNNEPVVLVKKEKLVTPGSGLSWMLNIVELSTKSVQIVDISNYQIKFCQELWNSWDGENYGQFVWNFIKQNKIEHYQLDNPGLTQLDYLKLKNKSRFVEYVNNTFDRLVDDSFRLLWKQAKLSKTATFIHGDLVKWVIDNDTTNFDNVWYSNILNYKWTLLHTTKDECIRFQAKIK
jgi:hypothetical protein